MQGPGYKWEDLFSRIQGVMRPNIEYDVPSTAETMAYFLMDILLFATLAIYFDHVDSSNRGKTYGKLFFLDCILKKKNKNDHSNSQEEINEINNQLTQREQRLLDKKRSKDESLGLSCNILFIKRVWILNQPMKLEWSLF